MAAKKNNTEGRYVFCKQFIGNLLPEVDSSPLLIEFPHSGESTHIHGSLITTERQSHVKILICTSANMFPYMNQTYRIADTFMM